jgi:hypothetical protein
VAETTTGQEMAEDHPSTVLDIGGLRFDVSLREPGATLRVLGEQGDEWVEMLRFDDFVEQPHYHVPAAGPATMFDRSLGDPLAWYVAQIRDHLAERLDEAGFQSVLASIDLDEVSQHADEVSEAMTVLVPDGCVRVPGIGLQRLEGPA